MSSGQSGEKYSQKAHHAFGIGFLTTEYIQIKLGRNSIGPWIFVDEVTFQGETAQLRISAVTSVPEAGSTLALLGAGLTSLWLFRRRS